MATIMCAGGCDRLISVSAVPGGNPVARNDPAGYASQWSLCGSCRGFTCDQCLGRQQGRCRCGQAGRLLSEPERIRIAQDMSRGLKPTAPSAPAAGPPAVTGGVHPSMLPQALFELGRRIDFELGQNQRERAASSAAVAASMMLSLGREVAPEHMPWLMSFGESFFRWRFFAEGAEFWKGVYQHFDRHGATGSDPAVRAVATAGGFQVLGGLLPPDGPVAQQVLGMLQKVFGPQHPLAQEVQKHVASRSFGAPPAPPPGAPSAVDMRPQAPRASAVDPSLDASGRLALWVTLAFLDIAAADGKVGDEEYLVWKRTMATMELPDVWGRYGTQGLADLLKRGALQQLSVELSSLDVRTKGSLIQMLHGFVMADGKAEARELEAMATIGSWLGVNIKFS